MMKREDIYKSDFSFNDSYTKENTTGTLTSIMYNGYDLYFSYETLIAYYTKSKELRICENVWSRTTGKHLYNINPNKSIRLDHAEFIKLAEKDLELSPPVDPFKSIASISAIFSLMSNNQDVRKTNNQRLRFYETQGLTRPDDWDSLSETEQKERLDKIDAFNLKGA